MEQYIPFEKKEFRPHQKEAIEQILGAIDNGVETIILNAPVGAGKSLIGYCVAKTLQENAQKSYIYTKTTFLQDQYLKDFKDINSMVQELQNNTINLAAMSKLANINYIIKDDKLNENFSLVKHYQKVINIRNKYSFIKTTYPYTFSILCTG